MNTAIGARRSVSLRLRLIVLALAVAALGATGTGALALGHSGQHAAAAASSAPVTEYRDPQGQFGLAYPAGWQPVPVTGSGAALILREGNTRNSVLVRVLGLDAGVDPKHLARAEKLTDSLVGTKQVRVLIRRPITLHGTPGFYYLYTFGTAGTSDYGVHAHYFLFPGGKRMDVLVMQALPDTQFAAVAPDFDRISTSYRPLT